MGKEKKEIGKLLELLNEYEPYIASDGEHRDNLWGYAYQGHSAVFQKEIAESYIMSKSYGFIKWLVENDKIDTDAYKTVYSGDLDKWKTLTMSSGGDEFYQVTEHGVYESLIMLLSISDTPIEDLINYLK